MRASRQQFSRDRIGPTGDSRQYPGAAKRATGRGWFDIRLLIGTVLVVASMVGVYVLVSSADTSIGVYTASGELAVGDRISAADLGTAEVRLGTTSTKYLAVGEVPEQGVIVTRSIAAGELIPSAAVGSTAGADFAAVVLDLRGILPGSLTVGSTVDVWSASETSGGVFGPPAVLVHEAAVVRILESRSMIAESGRQSLELLIPRSRVAAVLEAVANGHALSAVPASMPITGERVTR